MRNFFCLSLSRFTQASTAALIALVLAGAARADTIKVFDISGTAVNNPQRTVPTKLGSCDIGATCAFSGTLSVNVTKGEVTAVDITFPGVPTFDITNDPVTGIRTDAGLLLGFRNPPSAACPLHGLFVTNCNMSLLIETRATPNSLVGFVGGTILARHPATSSPVSCVNSQLTCELYIDVTGSITGPSAVPEPSSLVLLCSGLMGLVGMVVPRIFLSRSRGMQSFADLPRKLARQH